MSRSFKKNAVRKSTDGYKHIKTEKAMIRKLVRSRIKQMKIDDIPKLFSQKYVKFFREWDWYDEGYWGEIYRILKNRNKKNKVSYKYFRK